MATRSDSEIKQLVEEELRYDASINATDIGVSGKNGEITLTGFVHSYMQKLQAEQDAKRVSGVRAVANDIEVRLPGVDTRPDPEIARDALAQLKIELPYSSSGLSVTAKNGWLTLEGSLEWQFQRHAAEMAVHRPKGVIGVTNLISLRPKADARDIKQKIQDAFKRNAQLDANDVSVETAGSEAILRGTVRSWAEREEAEHAAWMAPGVTKVDDRIVINP